ncbi:tumor necrosis factor b (TNF superfamily, member 2) [Parambassis ranga]|uniref:Lymphotoxin-alpha n=1 Tax=Parambassis ranga TaxID=210632 RepID=A0A6P7HLJ3_9TELE|nr:tumor necrosis factor-like [Parambassis ranga]
MAAYTSTAGDLEAGVEERTVVVVERRVSAAWMWKVSGALLTAALCFGGVLLCAWLWSGSPEQTTPPGQTEALIRKDAAERTDPHMTLRQISSKAKAAIHLEGSYDDDEDSNSKLEWRDGQGQAFAQGGFRLVKNGIIIPQNGLYFVYSQASFRASCGDGSRGAAGRHPASLSHRIWRFSDSVGGESSLMSAVRSACQSAAPEDGQGWYNAIYLGAVFQLNRGDRLQTETNPLSELETDAGQTFFGVFAL